MYLYIHLINTLSDRIRPQRCWRLEVLPEEQSVHNEVQERPSGAAGLSLCVFPSTLGPRREFAAPSSPSFVFENYEIFQARIDASPTS